MRKAFKSRFTLPAAAAVLCLSLATAAWAEVDQQGNLRVSFNGIISPSKLPRDKDAPIGVVMSSRIKTTDMAELPPKLTQISMEINRKGKLQSKGLPLCPLGRIQNASTAGAKASCGKAEVGRGNVTTLIRLPGQGIFATNGPMVAFNGRYKGRPAILAHVNSKGTLAITYVMIFQVKKGKGTFGTKLVAKVPPIASGNGYISSFNMSLRRIYRAGGKRMSYLTASCPLPKDVKIASFPLARTSFSFEDGRKLSAVLNRECRARG